MSLKRNPTSPKSQFIRAIILTKGVHFYGFHTSYSPFLKIYLADPNFSNRAVTILQSGTVMKTRFRVYESHINFVLQFMCDFGLYGCGWMDLCEVWERGAKDPFDDLYDSNDHHEQDEQRKKSNFKQSPYFRQSRMPLEVDAAAHQILTVSACLHATFTTVYLYLGHPSLLSRLSSVCANYGRTNASVGLPKVSRRPLRFQRTPVRTHGVVAPGGLPKQGGGMKYDNASSGNEGMRRCCLAAGTGRNG